MPGPKPHLAKYRFKPGQSGNPSGKHKTLLTRPHVEYMFQELHTKTVEELQTIMKDPKSQMLTIMVASIMIKTVETGDAFRLQFLLDRAVGKVINIVESEDERQQREQLEALNNLSDKELIEMALEKIPLLEAKKKDT